MVKQLWRNLELEEARVNLTECASAQDMLMNIFMMEQRQRLLIIAMLWKWWTARNKKNAGDSVRSLDEVVFNSRKWTMEFSEFYAKKKETRVQEGHEPGWMPPGEDELKVNIDGAFKDNSLNGGWGFFIMDHEGRVAGSGAGVMHFQQNALHAEAEACIQGLTAVMN
jgi:hypothetical protein